MYYLVDIGDFLLIRMLIGLLTSLVSSRLTVLGFSTSVRLSVLLKYKSAELISSF
jgi:hypothetical protein